MRTYPSLITAGLFAISAGIAGIALPASVGAVEGESQLSGQLMKIDGDRYTVQGEHGKNVTLRVTKDTNIICARSKSNQMFNRPAKRQGAAGNSAYALHGQAG
ncbi:MAG: hypothetical protein QM771_00290 [Nitrospira sp.]